MDFIVFEYYLCIFLGSYSLGRWDKKKNMFYLD